jgi:hypothetical protein
MNVSKIKDISKSNNRKNNRPHSNSDVLFCIIELINLEELKNIIYSH